MPRLQRRWGVVFKCNDLNGVGEKIEMKNADRMNESANLPILRQAQGSGQAFNLYQFTLHHFKVGEAISLDTGAKSFYNIIAFDKIYYNRHRIACRK